MIKTGAFYGKPIIQKIDLRSQRGLAIVKQRGSLYLQSLGIRYSSAHAFSRDGSFGQLINTTYVS